jgi:hypothetical protein
MIRAYMKSFQLSAKMTGDRLPILPPSSVPRPRSILASWREIFLQR